MVPIEGVEGLPKFRFMFLLSHYGEKGLFGHICVPLCGVMCGQEGEVDPTDV